MSFANAASSYRHSSIEGASPIGLVVALYDRLIEDLQLAADALRRNDIEARCHALNHASLVLGQLQDWIDPTATDPLRQNLLDFYHLLRTRLLEASLKRSAEILVEQIELIAGVRSAWQRRDAQEISPVHNGVAA
jgi:flagellar protein FliS